MTQHQSTKDETQKQKIEEHISSFQQSKGMPNTYSKPNQLVRQKPKTNTNNSNQGFIDVLILSLITTFIIGFAVGIGYMLYRFTIGG